MNKLIVSVLLLLVAGCATISPTQSSLAADFAGILGVRPNQVSISEIEQQDYQTFFVATTQRGKYNCAISSGALAALVARTITKTCTQVEGAAVADKK